MSKIRVFHLEDYQIMRDGVRRLLADDPAIVVVGEASTGEQMLKRIASIEVDVLIMDLYLDGMEDLDQMNGFELCKLVKQQYPNVKMLAYSAYEDADKIAKILKTGAMGFVSKKSSFGELLHAVKVVSTNQVYLCLHISKKLKNLNNFLSGIEDQLIGNEDLFSPRERDILASLVHGKSSKEVGQLLGITERTVETHRKNMIQKSKTKNTVELIAYAVSIGLVKK